MLVSRLLAYKLYKLLGFPKIFPMNITLGLSYKCNSRCKTCNIWKKRTFSKEFTLNEFAHFFKKTGKGKVYLLVLTGGEPFLHKDLVKIVELAEKHLKPTTIVIPTNALLGELVIEKTKLILGKLNKTHLTINISLDGIGDEHDNIRGIKGNFKKIEKIYPELKKLEKAHKNFDVGVHSVISKFNNSNFNKIKDYVAERMNPQNYICEIAENRYELDNINANLAPNFEEYSKSINHLIRDLQNQKSGLKQALRIEYYKMVKRLLKEKRQIIPCYAGIASAQIDPTGEVWFCCVRAESIGNLRYVDYDLMKLWYNKKAIKQRKSIAKGECYCPLASANYTNLALDFKSSLKVIINLLRSKLR